MGLIPAGKGRAWRFRRGLLGAVLASFAVVLAGGARVHADSMLTIIPTFASNITNDTNAAAIENTILSAINYYQSTFTTKTANPINVRITFQEGGGLGGSSTTLFATNYQTFINALTAASSGDSTDTTALAHLPTGTNNPVSNTTNIWVKSANLRALGLNGTIASDGTITLNTSLTTPGSPGTSGQYSLFAVTEHEIDEVLGFGSNVGFLSDPAPQDLFRYDNAGNRTFTTAGDNAFFSLNGTTDLVQFNQRVGNSGDYGDWHISSPARVQDWAATIGSSPTLATDAGQVEIVNLDAIGYNLAAAVPEPASVTLLGAGALLLAGNAWRRRKQGNGQSVA
jgi:hypothetical protein